MKGAEGDEVATPGAVSDPRVVRSRAAILEAAVAEFVRVGYLAASLDDIAVRAGVAKRTIYNVVGGKEELFRATLAEAIDTAERFSLEVAGPLAEVDDVEAGLRDTGRRLAQAVLGGRIVPLRRLLIGEAARFPDLAQDYYCRAPGRVMDAIAGSLRRFHERGVLLVEDVELAAEQFAFLVLGASLDRALFEPHGAIDAGRVDARAHAGVEVFLRAYRTGTTSLPAPEPEEINDGPPG